jgi:formylglycine-generating enzyme required for sulfatase activity/predicted neuraminidase
MKYRVVLIIVLFGLTLTERSYGQARRFERLAYTNSAGMKMVPIDAGSFMMGQERKAGDKNITLTYGDRYFMGGEVDEQPVHKVNISKLSYMGATEVTNAQYELFDPSHREYRGRMGLSKQDNEAVVFVSWHDAVKFCQWLSKKEGNIYRLPTEAEWEYACRAGTKTRYNTGDTLPEVYQKSQKHRDEPEEVPTHVAAAPANAWGLYDMHGNVEEWCYDWYGPYEPAEQTDPVGRASGLWRVVRGGSHNVYVKSLRSANRLSNLAEDKHWLTGFRVVQGEMPGTSPLPAIGAPQNQQDVNQKRYDWPKKEKPYFEGPVKYVLKPDDPASVPFFFHNHVPSITWCDNGDLLAAWFSCARERGRELGIVATRFRRQTSKWDEASAFFNARERNMHGTGLFNDGKGRLLHLNGLGTDGWWSKLALTLRVSTDNGATWSYPKLVDPEHGEYCSHMGISRTKEGYIIFPCDAPGGTGLYMSKDDGQTWAIATIDGSRKTIMGSHAAAVQLEDGSLFSLGRGKEIDGRMPVSHSRDMGKTWEYYASDFPPVSGGQRALLLRLNEGPILFIGFTDRAKYQKVILDKARPRMLSKNGIVVKDAAGKERRVYGMFGAVSFDEGKTWPVKKLITAGGAGKKLNGEAWTQDFIMDDTHAEPLGYLAMTQSPDNVVQLASSGQHYRFNLAWLRQPMPADSGKARTFFMGQKYPATNDYANQPGVLGMEFIFEKAPFEQCHASTIAASEDGLVSAWFGGTHEKNPDVGIWVSRNTPDGWTDPVEVANGVQSPQKRYPCWNPILFQPRPGPLMLFYKVGPDPQSWWGMLKTSQDCGRTWSPPQKLPEGFVGPVKNKPLQLPGGDILCPSSTENNGWRVHFERYNPTKNTWKMIGPINDGKEFGAIQPSILTYLRDNPTRDKMQVLCRSGQNVVTQSWTKDGGLTWGKMTATTLPNPNAGTDAVTLNNGWQLLVYNHTTRGHGHPRGREMLNVAVSEDGENWKAALVLEKEKGEFSYPAVIQTSDDLVHIVHTWKRRRVKHVVLDPAKLDPKDFRDGEWPG